MEIYLVRHGETTGNLARRHQHPNTRLTEKGEAQAKEAATQLKEVNPTHLITSTNVRAVETAKYIGEACNLVPETYPAFEELRRPGRLYGVRLMSLGTLWYMFAWYIFPKLRNNDESYVDLLSRLKEAREHLEALPQDSRVVVVSHSVFINLFVAHLCHNRRLGPFLSFKYLYRIFTIKNGSITKLIHDNNSAPNTCAWRVVS